MAGPNPWRSLWRRLLLVAILLACGNSQASSQISINPDSLLGLQGYVRILVLENAPTDALEYSWHRGADDKAENMIVSYKPPSTSWRVGPEYRGRENVTLMGNLAIREAELSDSGNYTVRVEASNGTQRATGWLEILELEEKPGIWANTTSVVEDLDSIEAVCYTNVTSVKWLLNAVPVSSSDQLTISPDGKTLVIRRVSRHNLVLQCAIESFTGILLRSKLIYLNVTYGPDRMWLSTKPSDFLGVLSAEIGSQVEMTCDATSKPQARYRWLHNGSFLSSDAQVTFPSLAWEQMGSYRCIVENPLAQLTMYKDIRIQVPVVFPTEIKSGFSISGSMVVWLIVATVLGSVYFCGIVIYRLVNHYSNRTSRGIGVST